MAELKDSGARKEFDTGAVRDIREGKGRCDLLPMDTVDTFLAYKFNGTSSFIRCMHGFKFDDPLGTREHLYDALFVLSRELFPDKYTAVIEVSKQFEDGARKYAENNWMLGIPVKNYVDSAIRHYLKCKRGDTDEPHDRACFWNVLCCIWTIEHLGG